MSFLRGLFPARSGRRDAPAPVFVPRDVGHRVFVERRPDAVWPHLLSPEPGAELGVDCALVLPLPAGEPGGVPELVGVWRRSNGRLRVGLGSVVDVEPGARIVTRSSDGAAALTLTTTLEALDHGCVVAQLLDGVEPTDPAAEFARAWMARALLGLKADVEGTPRPDVHDRGDAALTGVDGPVGGAGAGAPGVAPVHESADLDVAAAPQALWDLLSASSSEQLTPSVERVVRVELAGEPGGPYVLSVHRHADGRRGAAVSLVVEAVAPSRAVERDLTASHESDVVTTIEAVDGGSHVTETFTGWLPSGTGHAADSAEVAAFLRARLEALRQRAEHAAAPPRDPRTGFRPPEEVAAEQAAERAAAREVERAGEPGARAEMVVPAARPSVPSSVVLPPPHVAAPAAGYGLGQWSGWGDSAYWDASDLLW